MSEPSLEERKRFWLWNYANTSFESALEACGIFERESARASSKALTAILAGIVVTYAKPFMRCHGVGELPDEFVPSGLRRFHDPVMNFRHKLFAHLDSINFHDDQDSVGNLNNISIRKNKNGEWSVHVGTILPTPLYHELHMRELCERMLEKAGYHLDRFNARYVAKRTLKPGKYLLNIDAKDLRAFVPIK